MIKRINLFGCSGSGKSRTAARLYADLINHDIELVREWVKDWAYLNRPSQSFDPFHIFGQQQHLEDSLFYCGVERIITDSPLWFSPIYTQFYNLNGTELLTQMCFLFEQKYPSLNILLDRTGIPYQQKGRYQNEKEADQVHQAMINFLNNNKIQYHTFKTIEYNQILNFIKEKL